jgi:hypothetical protein
MRRGDQTALRRIGSTEGGAVPVLDVVFVHGLGGDGVGTWTPEDSSESWLDWLGQDIPSAAIWSLSYPAGATKWTTADEGMALPDRASNLIPTMLYYGIGSRKTVFVCHSLGGLLVKQVLRHSAEMAIPAWAPIADSTLGIAFLATPHSGSNVATIFKAFKIARPTRTSLGLTAHCPHLKELGDWYRQNAARLEIETVVYAESRRVKRGIRWMTVVTSTSADPGIEGCITTPLDADHIDISKPVSRETDAYRGIETFIRGQVRRVPPPADMANPSGSTGQKGLDQVHPPADLVRAIRELQAMGDVNLLNPIELSTAKMGIVKRHYGVDHE